uniref:Uncharacterized protein n=1 Tax=Tanacetum cinerariifolium TaxID=118510 RepID=A0A6L2NN35_TANCI|nr:hypothetical protein [Tanacetum cinerariifolium]
MFTEDEVNHQLFGVHFGKLEVDDKQFNHREDWTKVGKPTLTNHKEVLVMEPLMQIMHKLIVGSLVHGLASRERCQKRDLWMMSALEESHGVNLSWIIVDHLYKHAPRMKESNVICTVTLGMFTEDEVNHQLFGVHFGKLEVDDKQFNHRENWTKVGKPTLTNHKEVLVKEPLM